MYSPQFEHLTRFGVDNFHTDERLLSRLALDTFLFGTAIDIPPDILLNLSATSSCMYSNRLSIVVLLCFLATTL